MCLAAGVYEGGFEFSPLDGKRLTVRGEPGTGAEEVILDGGGTGRVLELSGILEGDVRLLGVTIQHGMYSEHGGGVYVYAWGDSRLTLELRDSILRLNEAGQRGGALAAHTTGGDSRIDLLLVNTLIYGNQARWSGGGVDVSASEIGENNQARAVMVNCTVTDNVADADSARFETGGGVRVQAYQGTGAYASLTMYNTIVHGNRLGSGTAQDLAVYNIGAGTTQAEAHHCDIGPVDDHLDLYTSTNVIDANPAFFDAAGNDYHLRALSLCVDGGTAAIPVPPGLPTSDFDGDARVIGVAPDIGVDEARPPAYLPLLLSPSG